MVNIIIGTGYVSLVSGACLADFGNTVVCVDSDANKIAKLKNGDITIFEPGLEEVVERNVKVGRLAFTTELGSSLNNSDVVFIAVGTPPMEDGSADLQYVEQVARRLGRFINKCIIIVSLIRLFTPQNIGKALR